MNIVDLSDQFLSSYLCCLEDWSDEMAEAGDRKAEWYATMKDRGLRVKLALDEAGQPVGMIQYLPIEHSIAEGEDLYMVMCIWVHGYDQGVGKHQGRGVGTALLDAAEEDVAGLGAKGLAAWGITLPFWMKASWFKKHGYRKADDVDGLRLMWKAFTDDAHPPRWVESRPAPEPVDGQVTIAAYSCGWCPANNLVYERAKRVAQELGPRVVFQSFDTMEKAAMRVHGHTDGVFLDGKPLQRGAPPPYERILNKTGKRLRRLESR